MSGLKPSLLIGITFALLSSTLVRAQVRRDDRPSAEAPRRFEPKKEELRVRAVQEVEQQMLRAAQANDQRKAVVQGMDLYIRQLIPQLRPILRSEYHFARAVCELSEEQRREIAREGEQILHDAAEKFADVRLNRMRPRKPGDVPFPDPRRVIRERLTNVLKERVSPRQLARYLEECEARDAERKLATLHNIVAKIDQDLALSAEQRDRLVKVLTERWDDAWSRQLEFFQRGDQMFPNIPDDYITPCLTDAQRTLWEVFRSGPRVVATNVAWPALPAMARDDGPLEPELMRHVEVFAPRANGTR